MHGIYLLPVNLYGPGDNRDREHAHVIPALIRKCVDARRHGQEKLVAWGTGQVSREFLYGMMRRKASSLLRNDTTNLRR